MTSKQQQELSNTAMATLIAEVRKISPAIQVLSGILKNHGNVLRIIVEKLDSVSQNKDINIQNENKIKHIPVTTLAECLVRISKIEYETILELEKFKDIQNIK
jgi:hypothetical protein